MKKLVLSLAVLFSVAMVSCGGGNSREQDSLDSVAAAQAAAAQNGQENQEVNNAPESVNVEEVVVAVEGDSAQAAAAQATATQD